MDSVQREIIKELSKKYDLNREDVEIILKTFFKKIRIELEKGNKGDFESFKTVRIPKFGAFYPNKTRFKVINNHKKQKDGE